MYDPVKNKFIGQAEIEKKFATTADKVREVQALIGDKSDNIPGVPGIGPKTAAKLIEQFGSLEAIYENIDQVKNDRQRRLLEEHKQDALISLQLSMKPVVSYTKQQTPMKSMTGYGRGTAIDTENLLQIEVEMTSVNRKNLDLQVSSPREWAGIEQQCRVWLADIFQRGRLNIQLKVMAVSALILFSFIRLFLTTSYKKKTLWAFWEMSAWPLLLTKWEETARVFTNIIVMTVSLQPAGLRFKL